MFPSLIISLFNKLISEKLPDSFKEFASEFMGKKKTTPEFLAYCHRELTHEQWRFLLDDEFLNAYEHGIVIECGDAIMRRFYPRIFTYSADYPEKYVYSVSCLKVAHVSIFIRVLMSSIRNLGGCPCPRCKIALSDVHLVGTKKDREQRLVLARQDDVYRQKSIHQARDAIYDPKRYLAVDSAYVERQMKPESLVPTSVSDTKCLVAISVTDPTPQNAFSDRLSRFGLNLFNIFPVDLMHEIELGVWKALLIHLLRILESANKNLLHELDKRSNISLYSAF